MQITLKIKFKKKTVGLNKDTLDSNIILKISVSELHLKSIAMGWKRLAVLKT